MGKTTTSINLAYALASKGHRTLLVDTDPQANSSMTFVDIHSISASIYDVLAEPGRTIEEVVIGVKGTPNLFLAPSSISLAKIESKLIGEIDSYYRMSDAVKNARDDFEFIIFDTPPTLGVITVNAMVASTHVLIPIQASYFALEGTDDLLETIDKIKARANPNLQILGAVITLYDKRTVLARDIKKQIAGAFGDKLFKTTIGKSVRLEESPAYRESIFTFAPNTSGADEYYRLTEEVLSRV